MLLQSTANYTNKHDTSVAQVLRSRKSTSLTDSHPAQSKQISISPALADDFIQLSRDDIIIITAHPSFQKMDIQQVSKLP
jgi:hypothetical protein